MKKKCDSRLSISLTVEHYKRLREMSEEQEVSIAWVVRKAIDRYIENESSKDKGLQR